jgi:hypothetical protein
MRSVACVLVALFALGCGDEGHLAAPDALAAADSDRAEDTGTSRDGSDDDAGVADDADVASRSEDAAPADTAERGVLTSLGPAPTPISLTAELDTATHHVFLLFESTASLVVATVDKQTGRVRERVVAGTKIAYALQADVSDPSIVWIAASIPASLLRYDLVADRLEVAATFDPDSHAFDLDQGSDGALYIGTYPSGRCLRVPRDPPRMVTELVPPRGLAGGRPYLHGVFAGGNRLLLHYASPGLLVRHDLENQVAEVVLTSTQSFLGFFKSSAGLTVSAAGRILTFDRNGLATPGPIPQDNPPRGLVRRDRVELALSGATATVSLAPRSTGMAITFLGAAAGHDVVVGGTYWNHWLFTVEQGPPRLRGWGALPQGSGEFFTIGLLGGLIAIPSYQGDLYLFDPASPLISDAPETLAATKIAHVPGAHFGIATANDAAGTLWYATAPNYDRPGGMLVRVDQSRALEIRERLDGDTTIAALAYSGGALIGGSKSARGLGLGPPTPHLLRVVRFDPATLATIATSTCSRFPDDMRALVQLPGAPLAAVTVSGEILTIETQPLRCASVDHLGERALAAIAHEGRIVILTPTRLIAWDVISGTKTTFSPPPPRATFLASAGDGAIYLASQTEVYRLLPVF